MEKEYGLPGGSRYPVLGFAGWSGSGKTTLLEKLIPKLKERGLRVAVIKHDVHGLKQRKAEKVGKRASVQELSGARTAAGERELQGEEFDVPGTDSFRLRRAGADAVILCGPEGPDLERAVFLAALEMDKSLPALILVEGFKRAEIPQIGMARKANGKGFTAPLSRFAAVVTDEAMDGEAGSGRPVFGPEQAEELADFIISWMRSKMTYDAAMGTVSDKGPEGEREDNGVPALCEMAPEISDPQGKEAPSMDEWMREAKEAPGALKSGSYMVHCGVVRETARAQVRGGDKNAPAVKGMRFSYDGPKLRRLIDAARQTEGIFYVRAWLNEGELEPGDDIMRILIGGDIRPHVLSAMEELVGKIKTECVNEQELF